MTISRSSAPAGYSNLAIGRKMKKPTGFKNVQASIASKEDLSKKAAGAILASATRKASSTAKAKNPNLKKVK